MIPYVMTVIPALIVVLGVVVLILALSNFTAERQISDIERRIDHAEAIRARANAELEAWKDKKKADNAADSRPIGSPRERGLL